MGNRIKVLDGEVRPGKTIVAESVCEIYFEDADNDNLQKCISEIRKSGARNALKADGTYDWQSTYIEDTEKGQKVIFGVAWYDKDFFEDKKDVYLNPLHVKQFAKFGKTPTKVDVSHHYTN